MFLSHRTNYSVSNVLGFLCITDRPDEPNKLIESPMKISKANYSSTSLPPIRVGEHRTSWQ